MSCFVSFIVPIYKVEKYLSRCIESLLCQEYKNWEMILVDDGSPDNSGAIADEYAKLNHNIIVIHKINGGLSEARNSGIKKAKGKYLFFLDSDDYLSPHSLANIEQLFIDNPDVLFYNIQWTYPTKSFILHKSNIEKLGVERGCVYLEKELSTGNFMAMAQGAIVRRDFLIDNSLYFKKGIYHEDEHWMPRVELAAQKVKYSPQVFYIYEIRPNSITTHGDNIKNGLDLCSTCEELYSEYYLKQRGQLQKYLLRYNAKLYLRALSIVIRLGKTYSIKYNLIRNNALSLKDRLLFNLFLLQPKLYAKLIDKYILK